MIKIATPISHQFLRKNLAKEIYKLSDCFENDAFKFVPEVNFFLDFKYSLQ